MVKKKSKKRDRYCGYSHIQGQSGYLFIERGMLHLFIHNLTRSTNAFATLFAYRNKLAQLLNRFGLISTHNFTKGFITDGITQADVH